MRRGGMKQQKCGLEPEQTAKLKEGKQQFLAALQVLCEDLKKLFCGGVRESGRWRIKSVAWRARNRHHCQAVCLTLAKDIIIGFKFWEIPCGED